MENQYDKTQQESKIVLEKKVAPIFLMNQLSATLIIPIAMARRKGLAEPTNVVVEETEDAIVIRKLEI